MSALKTNDNGAEHYESTEAHQVSSNLDEKHASGNVVQVQAASVALAAAVAAQKPSLWSKSMLQLYFIMYVPLFYPDPETSSSSDTDVFILGVSATWYQQ